MLSAPELNPQVPKNALLGGFNFGPNLTSNKTVADLVQEIILHMPGEWVDESDPHARHEAGKLNLAIDKAFHLLQWQPVWKFDQTVKKTVDWYVESEKSGNIAEFTQSQIANYVAEAQSKGIAWSQ